MTNLYPPAWLTGAQDYYLPIAYGAQTMPIRFLSYIGTTGLSLGYIGKCG